MKRKAFIQMELLNTMLIVSTMLIGSTGYYIIQKKAYDEVVFKAESQDFVNGLQYYLDKDSVAFKTALNTNGYTCYTFTTSPAEGYCSMKFGTKYNWFKRPRNVSISRLAAVTCRDGKTGFEVKLTNSTLATSKESFYYKSCGYSEPGLFGSIQSTLL